MRLYLVQHGEAAPKEENPDRPLTDKGRRDVRRMASFLSRSGVRVGRVIHSGRRRARDTATLLAQVLAPVALVEEAAAGLAPDDGTDVLLAAIADWREDIMVVGHQPFMGRMVARLIGDDANLKVVDFQPGTVVSLERNDASGAWTIVWMAGPGLLGQ